MDKDEIVDTLFLDPDQEDVFFDGDDINGSARDKDGNTLLHHAAECTDIDIMKMPALPTGAPAVCRL
eukprot:gene4230-768_t